MYFVYVLDKDGKPLMPTKRFGKVRRMLKDGRAVVADRKPFTIRLTYEPETHVTQDIYLSEDAGRTNIGVSAVRSDGQCLYLAHVETRNKQIKSLMEHRKAHRQASRRGERLVRKRRAKEHGTIMRDPVKQRRLPGCKKGVLIKDIINSEARFNNRRRRKGWLTPTVEQLLRTHLNVLDKIRKILPVTDVCLEINKFAFMALDDPSIWKHRQDFQNGPLKGYKGVNEAVDAMQEGKCLLCGGPIEQHHHMLPKHENGSDTFVNIVGLCKSCHDKVHKDAKTAEKLSKLHGKRNKKYGALSVLNQIIPHLADKLKERFGAEHVYFTTGYETMLTRKALGLDKTHDIDAYCIAMQGIMDPDNMTPTVRSYFPETFEIQQFRRHDRAVVNSQRERTYRLDGEIVAKNRRKRTSQDDKGQRINQQPYDSLHEWYLETKAEHGKIEAKHIQSQLEVTKSTRHYNDMNRVMPGAIFSYEGKQYVLSGQISNGTYYRAFGCGERNFPARECKILKQNTGLVYI